MSRARESDAHSHAIRLFLLRGWVLNPEKIKGIYPGCVRITLSATLYTERGCSRRSSRYIVVIAQLCSHQYSVRWSMAVGHTCAWTGSFPPSVLWADLGGLLSNNDPSFSLTFSDSPLMVASTEPDGTGLSDTRASCFSC